MRMERRPAPSSSGATGGIVVACGEGALLLEELEPAGVGDRLAPGDRLG